MNTHILIVDDEILQLNSIGNIIRHYRPDYEVITTHQPLEALRILKSHPVNAMMVDVKMPQMNGIELIREARAMNIEPLEVIILSGFDDFKYAQSAISLNVLEYLLKPIDGNSLKKALNKLDETLESDQLRLQLANDYTSLKKRQCAAALFKKANGIELASDEEKNIESFGNLLRMILVENCSNIKTFLQTLPAATCVEPLGEKIYLLFVPYILGSPLKPEDLHLEGGCIVIGQSCSIDEIEQRWKELQQFNDTAHRLRISKLIQSDGDHDVLDQFGKAIRSRDSQTIQAMCAVLNHALHNGYITTAALKESAELEMTRLIDENLLPNIYSKRKQDLLNTIMEDIDSCDTAESICDTIGQLFTYASDQSEGSFVQNVRIYIDTHYGKNCSLNDISREFRYSSAHFSRLFTAEFGKPYTRYLAEYRLEKAKELLLKTTYSVNRIAQEVGIGEAGYLIRQFTKKYGISPNKFRQQA